MSDRTGDTMSEATDSDIQALRTELKNLRADFVKITEILKDFGWPSVDIGGIEGARLLEPLCILWVGYGLRTGTWNHAFKLLRE